MNWLDMDLQLMQEIFDQKELPKYRAKQVYTWLHKGATFDEMTNLPKPLRETLANAYPMGGAQIFAQRQSNVDDTVKYLFLLPDEHMIEGVLMRYQHGNTLCISSQVGCRMGCYFCASTLDGLHRNLTAGEMLGQILSVEKEHAKETPQGARYITNIVMMGCGEPLDNYDQVIRFLHLINSKEGINISLRNISVSTCGLTEKIRALAQDAPGVNLSISLHAATDELRRTMMPIANRVSIADLMEAARYFVYKTSRRVIFEYALVAGKNDTDEQMELLVGLLRGLQCHVNLIPLNHVEERNMSGSSRKKAYAFAQKLTDRGISATVRREMGTDIEGACGQLRRRYLHERQNNVK